MIKNRAKEIILGLLVVLVLGSLVLWVYNNEKSKGHRDLARRIAALSPRGGLPDTIEGLKAAIALYEEQIELNVKTGAQTGAYWKILAIRLADRGMHREALDALERAMYYNAEDPALYHLTGESASIVAASVVGFSANSSSEREHFLRLAETAYLRAVQLDATYSRPRLGLGILYAFDLDRPEEAIPHMEHYLQISPNDISGMFVLARACYMTDNFERAIELYDRIISQSRNPEVRAEAQSNKEIIRELM
jgi:tetratricopeptide (TPR) repeat protein